MSACWLSGLWRVNFEKFFTAVSSKTVIWGIFSSKEKGSLIAIRIDMKLFISIKIKIWNGEVINSLIAFNLKGHCIFTPDHIWMLNKLSPTRYRDPRPELNDKHIVYQLIMCQRIREWARNKVLNNLYLPDAVLFLPGTNNNNNSNNKNDKSEWNCRQGVCGSGRM